MNSINSITFITTNTCTAKCAHCSMSSGPDQRGRLSGVNIQNIIEEAISKYKIKLVIFAGGEPTLLKNDLFNAIAICSENGIISRIVTNASWASTPWQAKKMIKTLRDAGLDEINISYDDYHEPFISINSIKNAWLACKNVGFKSVIIANAHSNSSKITPDWLRESLSENIPSLYNDDGHLYENVQPEIDGTFYGISNAVLMMIGDRAKGLSKDNFNDPVSASIFNSPCPWVMNSIAISPSGLLWACCGTNLKDNSTLELGDVKDQPLDNAISQSKNNILLDVIKIKGPYAILEKACEILNENIYDKKYRSLCELCEDVTTNIKYTSVINEHIDEIYFSTRGN